MKQLAKEIIPWLHEARQMILENLNRPMNVETKSAANDLVTSVDKNVQQFLISRLLEKFPEDKILGEEEGMNQLADFSGRVWVIDPIDGTLNFVLQKENFCIMLALYIDGKSQLGFIFDVMKNELYWGGATIGVFCNENPLPKPKDQTLDSGLMGTNAFLYGKNKYHAKDIGNATMGVRMIGCAGLEMIAILKGTELGYLSNLQPWDYAPGCALLDAFAIPYGSMDGEKLDLSRRQPFLAAQPTAYQEIQEKFFK
ncbi:inositol monophosphatase family protein [Enterococcus timonensis]|uniref:inositol monophosphatase family protein n=1 Tax=Enterococcus timonensis TaxID=1852364 RepID=UPI0008DB32FF|nr:inositol monophosphatase family protein [Enterococcus timonensis]